ncbi:hypothetical protein PVL29_026871 [Vitis rotundifolia]|uniref:Cytochrome P450 n=1 Tax=Vitis rotundifolia TaxID=103349 RepID=A0AA38YHK5_VITRO|nr:hypothetical protein PVL29_026871 [Vitis rotundifolia]
MFIGTRRDEIKILLHRLSQNSRDNFARVELRLMFTEPTCNIVMRMVAGKRYYGEDVDFEEAKHFHEVMRGVFELAGVSNPGEFFPLLRWIKTKKEVIFQGLIDEHRSSNRGLVNKNSMINHLLSMQKSEPEYYTDEIIKAHSLILILVGTETAATTIEWAMSLLLNHPEVMKKARVVELDTHVGKERLMEESNFPKLQYLQSTISETLRLFPAAPVLVPHMSSDNCQIGGNIQRDTILLVNAWAIHRDPKLWKDATSFKPERFENRESETYKLAIWIEKKGLPWYWPS